MAEQKLFVKLALQNREFARGMKKSKSQLKGLKSSTKGLGDSLKMLKRIAVAAFVGWGIKKLAGSFLDAANEAQGYQVRLNALLGSQEEGNRLFKEMAEYAGKVPHQFSEIMGAATALAGVMKGGVDEVSKYMPLIGDLAAVTGLSIMDTTGQIIRMYSAGAASADMFRERGILAMMGFTAGVKYSAEETREIMFNAWEATGSKFKDVTKELAKTWAGTMSMFKDQWFQFRVEVMEAGPFQAMTEQAHILLAEIQRLKEEGRLAEWAHEMAVAIVGGMSYAVEATQFLVITVKAVSLAFEAVTATVEWSMGLILAALQKVLEASAWIYKMTGFKRLAQEARASAAGVQVLKESFQDANKARWELVKGLKDGLIKTAKEGTPILNTLAESLNKVKENMESMNDVAKQVDALFRESGQKKIAIEKEVAETIKDLSAGIVEAEEIAADERVSITQSMADRKLGIERVAAETSVDFVREAATEVHGMMMDTTKRMYQYAGNMAAMVAAGGRLVPLGAASGGAKRYGKRISGFQAGTDFVPRTGLYQLHKGERVTPADRSDRSIKININYNAGSGGARQDMNELARMVRKEMERLENRGF